ncbi:two pore domain potassium channel family protein [Halomonas sp. D1-1]|uniref:Two pore domain potassium channel family protein n=1 Tax=Halomonas icarae TaxID=2691040 RepID=A0A7X4VWZ0_9GAMM|nr:two pore domain potassium channel family protein [Halomonas icarae]
MALEKAGGSILAAVSTRRLDDTRVLTPAIDHARLTVTDQRSPTVFDAHLDAGHLWAVIVTLIVVVLCILLHYEVSMRLWRSLERARGTLRRRFLMLSFVLFATHVTEIWMFAVGMVLLAQHPLAGSLEGIATLQFLDFVYFSAITYTTLGYGDLIPTGPLRFITGSEALLGFMLITWSASLTFLEMQRHWSARRER